MKETITAGLMVLVREHDVRILYACVSGSRAWGFPSADSDYDIRFIYVRPRDWYLTIDAGRDVLDQEDGLGDDLLDYSGWDLRKALYLLRKSNPCLLEWWNSPIVYHQNSGFDLSDLISQCYSPLACYYHYHHMAKSNYREFLRGDMVKVKKYFYVLRPLLAMMWINRLRGQVPMEFSTLVDMLPEAGLKFRIRELIASKRSGLEAEIVPRIPVFNDWIEEQLEFFDRIKPAVEDLPNPTNELNAFFRECL